MIPQQRLKTKANILYVDDDQQNLNSFKALFRREYNIFLASTAQAGLEIMDRENIQVLISDQRMPEMPGTELLEIAAQRFPKVKRFLLTAYSDFDPLVEAINRGKVQGYFSKPIDNQFIRSRIEEGLSSYYLEQENRHLLARIQQNEKFLSNVLENIPDIIFVKTADTLEFVCINKAGEEFLGLSRKEVINKKIEDFIPEPEAANCRKTDRQAITDCCLVNIAEECIITRNKSTYYLSTKKIPILDEHEQPKFILGVSRDITEQRQQQDREKELQKQLIKAQRMEAIGTLTGGIAHDFNNILTLILGFSELALSNAPPDKQLADNLNEIITAGKRGRDLIKQILKFSHHSEDEVKPIKVSAIASEVMKLMQASIPKDVKILAELDSDALITGNPTQIHQVFMNLCTNAAFAMQSSGGTLKIGIAEKKLMRNSAEPPLGLPAGKYLQIIVEDTGVGIEPGIIDAIFDPYFTTKDTGEGTGIGLAIVHGIIENHSGKITVSSTVGRGTRFTIYLPVIDGDAERPVVKRETFPRGKEHLLFVDDEPGITQLNLLALTQWGYHVIGCTDSLDALERFRSRPDQFDLVITDMAMPQMNGDRLSAEIVKIRNNIPIILCSGYLGQTKHELKKKAYIKAFLQKPIVLQKLAATVRKVLDDSQKENSCTG